MSTVLIVEDNRANLRLASDLLRQEGLEVLTAGDADTGMLIAREKAPDVIVMDIQLPGTDGLTATRLLKQDDVTRSIPILAMTAHAMRGDAERMLAAGCDGYVAKPIRYREFLAAIRELLADAGGG